jgi:hypothetical protein
MPSARDLFSRYRLLFLAMLASALLHAATILGVPGRPGGADDVPAVIYTASIDAAATVVDPGGAAPPPAQPKPAPRKPPKPRALPLPPTLPEDMFARAPEPLPEMAPVPEIASAPEPEKVALATPAAPQPKAEATPEPFPTNALPGNLKITYELNSSFADGRAVYEWVRNGDEYVISGEAEAVGFFTLFLEGRLRQEARGRVTSEGLRPERFSENRPNAAPDGIEFDWSGRKVTLARGEDRKTEDLKDNTVDWLSMIFQLAHKPPRGEAFDLRVFTQRRMYTFRLKVLGEEEIDLPIGRVKALHLRHVDEARNEYVDVWLGIDHHYVPVKLRYPVARNRVMVDQTAVRIVTE